MNIKQTMSIVTRWLTINKISGWWSLKSNFHKKIQFFEYKITINQSLKNRSWKTFYSIYSREKNSNFKINIQKHFPFLLFLFPEWFLFNCTENADICIDCDFIGTYSSLSCSGSAGKYSNEMEIRRCINNDLKR